MRRARSGDAGAFRSIVLALHDHLQIHLGAFAVTATLVDEVLQATFVTVHHYVEEKGRTNRRRPR